MLKLTQLVRDRRGATAVEYGLLLALLSIVMLAALNSVGLSLTGVFEALTAAMAG